MLRVPSMCSVGRTTCVGRSPGEHGRVAAGIAFAFVPSGASSTGSVDFHLLLLKASVRLRIPRRLPFLMP